MTPDTRAEHLAEDMVQLDALIGSYATAVDARDWQAWLGLFAAECSYAVYSLENVEAGLPLGYMIDDRRERLIDRVKFITEVWHKTIEHYRTRHVIQRLRTERAADGTYKVRSNMIVSYTEANGTPGVLVSGYYEDLIRMAPYRPHFVSKTVYLDGTPARYLVYPL